MEVVAELLKTTSIAKLNQYSFDKEIEKCNTCNKPLQKDIVILGEQRRVPLMCDCRAKELEMLKILEEKKEIQRRLDKFKRYSLMDEKFSKATFENWQFREDNQELYKFGKTYCENWSRMFENNRGLLLYGKAGNGKTYLSFAIANELYKQDQSVLAISVSRLLKIITDSYSNNSEVREMELLNAISETKLLILDDLGTENKTPWSYEKLYSIIDARYRAGKPIIVTTNYDIDGLRNNLSIVDGKKIAYDNSDRIYNRIVEMCASIEVNGESWRVQKGTDNKKALYEELGF